MSGMTVPDGEGARFWEDRYANHGHGQVGHVSALLAEIVEPRSVPAGGTALDLACGGGADSFWLALRGWHVVAVDIAPSAVAGVADHAEREGLAGQVRAEVHDLSHSFPDGSFDLISAQHFHTPFEIDRAAILRRAAEALRPGGILVVVDHGSTAPWSWNQDPDVRYPTPEEVYDELGLDPAEWTPIRQDRPQREANGPNGETAMITDNVLVVQRAAAGGAS